MDDVSMLLDHLAKAEKHVEQGQRLVDEQRSRLERAQRADLDVTAFKRTLRLLEETQALHVADRDRLRARLHELRTAADAAVVPPRTPAPAYWDSSQRG